MRTSTRRPAVLAATALTALALTLTACGGGGGTKDEGAAAPASPAAAGDGAERDGEAGTAGGPAGDAETTATKAGADKSADRSASKRSKGGTPACTADDVSVSAAEQEGVPTTHITLTATNTSGSACALLRYPLIAFGEVQTAKDVPAVPKSRPAAPVVLDPGAPAYAAVRINEGGTDEENHAVRTFSVNLFAADGPAEGSKVVTAPGGGIAVDDIVAKTGYWTPELRNGADAF